LPELLYEKHDNYAIFTLNRPERLNALGGSLRTEFTRAVADFDADPAMRAGIVTGAGRAFSAGMDLKEAADRAARGEHVGGGAFDGSVPRSFLQSSPKPFIAAVNGLAVGGGLETALQCDLRICSSEAYFGLFEPRRGILPGPGAHYLPRFIPAAAANYVLLTADRISPQQALTWGIVSEVVEPDRLMPRAVEITQLIASNAPLSVRGLKTMLQTWHNTNISESHKVYQWVAEIVFGSEDAKEGPTAFAEKRDAVWKGR
jgi:enoyl-CoA hydratase/carnithine racemase